MESKSWLKILPDCQFSLANIPFGIITYGNALQRRPAVAVGAYALDLQALTANSGFRDLSIVQPHQAVFNEPTLNSFAALGRPMHSVVRKYIQSLLLVDTPYPEVLKDNKDLQSKCLIPLKDVQCHMPMHIGDYTDFYAGKHHAFNCGVILRGEQQALQPNYKHLPVGYHGRASSVVISGTPIRRPVGQILEDPAAPEKKPTLSASNRLDMELELAAFVCKENDMGESIPVDKAANYIFGLVLMNDWSARDIQAWEYVPLGPFNGKNFGTSISPWVVLMDALEPFRTQGILNDIESLPYLQERESQNVYNINLRVELTPDKGEPTTITRTNAQNLLFSFPQMLAHHTVGGCPFKVGDLLGSGTISGTDPGSYGSFLEQSKGGKQAISLNAGVERTFLQDGDTVTFSGSCGDEDTGLVGFGECTGTILPARKT